MVSYMKLVYITGWLLACVVIYSQQAAISSSSSLNEQFDFPKRRIDAHARTSIPLFRGSNLGIFVRKRPMSLLPERSVTQRDIRPASSDEENILAELLYNSDHQQRRFDDYSENPGPMFGR
ncbi:unnamed protein product [Rotaria socialis]|uniref:Uncharacterized protein n=2 Tax=Rotaria socialis TaxID=392032 RepID=A0A817NHQ6_9BILA|nr:unnamed protein product [Rotaria socialis]CAF3522809.1 unnamed protein product [Rotaria socialis]CAF4214722.1 unnamed protein product [Rotaria socialis]CAF4253551.1 unnamed protein product [Rotaria socialis]CAF4879417.1 unnamed protein product [Rotaria socialis]